MAPEDGATRNINGGGGSRGGGAGVALKKGPWTAGEDAILIEYVKKHGEGNWNAVQRNSGLNRCGKSCRLRWANHLRPNLKKGAFTPEEERQIIELHSKLGNKWARMALHLHGRTDNEIKNYWNTRLKRRQRAGLPIYPMDMHHQQRRHHEASLNHQLHHPNSSSSSTSYNQKPNTYNAIPPLSLLDSFNYPSSNSSSYLPQSQPPFKLFRDTNGCVALSLSSPSPGLPFSTPSSNSLPLFNQCPPPLDFNMNNSIPTIDSSFTGVSLSHRNIETELPSIQSSFQVITPSSSSNTGNDYMVAPSSEADNYEITPDLCSNGNSGLLGDLLGESQALSRSQIQRTDGNSSSNEENVEKGKAVDNYELMEDPDAMNLESVLGFGDSDTTTRVEDSSSGHSSIEMGPNPKNGVADEINIEDDDFSDWLDIPITVPFTNWYDVSKSTSNGKVITDANEEITQENAANIVHENPQDQVSCFPVATAGLAEVDHKWTLGSCCWNNMPGFC